MTVAAIAAHHGTETTSADEPVRAGPPSLPGPLPGPDAALIADLTSGDVLRRDAAFEAVVAAYEPLLRPWLARALGPTADAPTLDDATAETFARLFDMVQRGTLHDEGYRLTAPLFAIARRVAYACWKRQANARLVRLPAEPAAEDPLTRLADPRAEQALDSLLDRLAIERALDTLAPRDREVFLLYDVENLPGQVVADRLGLCPNAVYQAAFRARAGLRKALTDRRASAVAPPRAG